MRKRIFGLDIMRSTAIVLVLICHLWNFAGLEHKYSIYLFGFYGVEIFFVLSGFLIGQILIKLLKEGITKDRIVYFWENRWLRTVPIYFIVLLLHIIFTSYTQFPYQYFVFLQNSGLFSSPHQLNFDESWSLAVEEYFYLLYPLLLWVLFMILRNTKKTLIASFLIVFPLMFFFKVFQFRLYDNVSFEDNIRKLTFIRLDSITFGIFIAFLKSDFYKIYKFLQSKFIALISLAVILICLYKGNILVYDFEGPKLFPSTIGIILNSFLLSLFIPYLNSIPDYDVSSRLKGIGRMITNIALFSYAMYLFHSPIFRLVIRSEKFTLLWGVEIILSVVILYVLSWLSFRYIEEPVMNFRKRLKKPQ